MSKVWLPVWVQTLPAKLFIFQGWEPSNINVLSALRRIYPGLHPVYEGVLLAYPTLAYPGFSFLLGSVGHADFPPYTRTANLLLLKVLSHAILPGRPECSLRV